MKKTIIIPTGYMGSGSSAVTDFLSEFSDINVKNGSFEYVFLHCPNGLFDLEDKLIWGNNALRSDEAIHSFRNQMKFLFDKKNFWAGSYKKYISKRFMTFVEEFIEEITTVKMSSVYWYYQQMPINIRMQLKCYFQRFIKKASNNRINISSPVLYNTIEAAIPTHEEFYKASKKFIEKIIDALSDDSSYMVLDQFILPHNLYRFDRYFDSNYKVIVVQRDPRDVFFLNKYIWTPNGNPVPYPLNVNDFCIFYKKMRENEVLFSSNNILRICFEDLVYKYDITSQVIISFLDISDSYHVDKKKFFNPSLSINNTQMFKRLRNIENEVEVIEKELKEYLYNFPEEVFLKNSENFF